ncbi:hypothetical protein Q5425_23060 [Amycolatopsis sp. A133]|uniref:hypothetical protein n=1 Tax=Amycolatopsis sp. A133 TaxID=3064472 RepID=UPI0027F140F0|nr:hypothetical protein [Amycolatopsis sp. A133]MDQ7806630.1 hypothetical protein [Amycolatopsis sp. A133]
MAEAKKAGCIAGAVALMGAIGALLSGIADFGGLFKDDPPAAGSPTAAAPVPSQPPAAGTTAAAAATVYFQGHLEFGRFNLDLNPPKRTGDTYIVGGTGGVFESYHDAGKLAVWTSGGTPDSAACGSAVDERGAAYISGVEKGNHVCGRTAEGRVFRVDVTGVSDRIDGGVTGDVTVWGK